MKKLWRLEAVRGLAALYVAASHINSSSWGIPIIFRFGQEAVIIFFLLSGFVIEYSFNNSRDRSFAGYFTRRFTRIYGVFIPMLIACMLTSRPDFYSTEFWRVLAGNIVMLQDFGTGKPNIIVPTIFASALWSLHYEWWFYMLYFPIKQKVKESNQSKLVGASSIIAAVVYTFLPYAMPRLIMYFAIWWIGVEMGRSYTTKGRVFATDIRTPVIAVFTVSLILATQCIGKHDHINMGVHPFLEPRHFTAAIAAVGAALLWQKTKWRGFNALKGGVFIAPVSYSLYIAHQPLLTDAKYLSWISESWARNACYAGILVLFCIIAELKLSPLLKQCTTRPSKEIAPAKPPLTDSHLPTR